MGGKKKVMIKWTFMLSLGTLFVLHISECTFHVIRCACCTRIFRNNVNGQTKTHSGERKIHNPLTSCIIPIDFPCSPLLQTQFSIFCTHRQRGERYYATGLWKWHDFRVRCEILIDFSALTLAVRPIKTVCQQLSPWKLIPKSAVSWKCSENIETPSGTDDSLKSNFLSFQ